MDIVVKLFWKQPLSLNEVLPISDIVVNIPFGTMIVDPTLSVPVTSVNGKIGDVVLTTTDVGATTQGYVDTEIITLQNSLQTSINTKANTSYVDTQDGLLQTAINTKADVDSVTQSLSTKADLVNGVVPSNQLPSYVDDVLEYANLTSLPIVGESGKIYVTLDTNKIYRWTGTTYIEISPTSGNADSATKLATPRTISTTGDATWSVSFDGSSDTSSSLTLVNTGVSSGTYQQVTVDLKGRVTNGTNAPIETTYSTTNPDLSIVNGTIQTLTLGANGTLSTDLVNGQSMTVLIPATSYTLNTSGFTVVNTFTLSATNLNVLVLFKVGSISYLVGINK